jgi:hypothetical protein
MGAPFAKQNHGYDDHPHKVRTSLWRPIFKTMPKRRRQRTFNPRAHHRGCIRARYSGFDTEETKGPRLLPLPTSRDHGRPAAIHQRSISLSQLIELATYKAASRSFPITGLARSKSMRGSPGRFASVRLSKRSMSGLGQKQTWERRRASSALCQKQT